MALTCRSAFARSKGVSASRFAEASNGGSGLCDPVPEVDEVAFFLRCCVFDLTASLRFLAARAMSPAAGRLRLRGVDDGVGK